MTFVFFAFESDEDAARAIKIVEAIKEKHLIWAGAAPAGQNVVGAFREFTRAVPNEFKTDLKGRYYDNKRTVRSR
jgi:hypothetical protein